ncbi:hypothetical protein [Streptomyces indicus]|uniref:Lipoprotein n=1 Tax=Streptomyces indicus TaxID=417292 RepID=A0A1G9EWR6_9ACTN|nr:hypothetical protein [Streptomyces indicus]SDK80550.1 hypothetical protein SAMN05421806_112101 [Streptomyces indicus]
MSPCTRGSRRILALTVAGVFALVGCGAQAAGAGGKKAVEAQADKPAGAPNGVEKLTADEAIRRSREVMAGIQSVRRVYTPTVQPGKDSPLITSEADLRTGCALRYDFGTYGKTDVRFTTTGNSPVVYMRLDAAALKNEHGSKGEQAAERYAGRFVADDQPDIMLYQRLVYPCELDVFSWENTEPGPGTRYEKGTPTEIDGMPVLPVVQTNADSEGNAAQTAYIALRGKPYIVRQSSEGYRADLSRFDEEFGIEAPGPGQTVPMAEFNAFLGIEAPHWEIDVH